MLDMHIERAFDHSPRHREAMREVAIRETTIAGTASAIGRLAREFRFEKDFPNPYRGVDQKKAAEWGAHFSVPVEPAEPVAAAHQDEPPAAVDTPDFGAMTKAEIVAYAVEHFAADLDKSRTKKALVDEVTALFEGQTS